jgi:Rap1a immunity proteins
LEVQQWQLLMVLTKAYRLLLFAHTLVGSTDGSIPVCAVLLSCSRPSGLNGAEKYGRSAVGGHLLCASLVALLVFASSSAQAQTSKNNGVFWLAQCTQPQPVVCISYLRGVLDLHSMLQHFFKRPLWCAPQEVGVEQTRLIVVEFLQRRPEELHAPFVGLVAAVMKIKFPCADSATKDGQR